MEFQAGLAGPSMSVAFAQLQGNIRVYMPVILGGTVTMSAVDLLGLANGGSQPPLFLYSLIGMFISLVATAAAWRGLSGQDPYKPLPIGSYIGAGLVSGIATLLGFILLILPGLFLLGRWSLLIIILQVEGVPAMDGLRRSWDLTERDWLAATIILVISGLGNLAGGAMVELLVAQEWPMRVAGILIGDSISTLASVWGCVAIVALYRFITGNVSQVDEIFG